MEQVINTVDIIGNRIVFIFQIISVVLILINLLKQIVFNFSKDFIITEVLKSIFLIIIIFAIPKIFYLVSTYF